jgi:RNA recognition motif-containing protein
MAYRAYVGNLPFSFAKTDLANLFAEFGSVKSAEIILDRETGRSRGFGFVELETAEQLKAAIDALNGKPVASRSLTVTEAREREARGPGGPRSGGPGGFRSGPPRDFGAPRSGPAPAGGPPRTFSDRGPAPGPGPGRAKPEREADRSPKRRSGMDDYDRHDKSWRRGENDGW